MHLTGETYTSPSAGLGIHRQVFRPDGGRSTGSVLVLHGMGDHLGCHLRAAELFCDRGYTAVGVDWPGHGRSEGKRGHVNGLKTAFGLIDETLAWLSDQTLNSGPRGVYAHSTGAFAFLNYLHHRQTQQGQVGDSTLFDWIWLGSPLLRPDHGQHPLKVFAAHWLAHLAPTLILDTKVRPERCRHVVPEGFTASQEMDGCHHWISAVFGADLVRHGRKINETARRIVDPTRLLLTQGEDDEVCPPEFSEVFFGKVGASEKKYALLPGMRHEIMREPGNEQAITTITDWLDENQAVAAATSS